MQNWSPFPNSLWSFKVMEIERADFFCRIFFWKFRHDLFEIGPFSQNYLLKRTYFFCLINLKNILQNLMSLKWMKRIRKWTLPSSPFLKKRLPFLHILLYIMQDSTKLSISILDALRRIYLLLKLFQDKK